jgi:hypothetical protein
MYSKHKDHLLMYSSHKVHLLMYSDCTLPMYSSHKVHLLMYSSHKEHLPMYSSHKVHLLMYSNCTLPMYSSYKDHLLMYSSHKVHLLMYSKCMLPMSQRISHEFHRTPNDRGSNDLPCISRVGQDRTCVRIYGVCMCGVYLQEIPIRMVIDSMHARTWLFPILIKFMHFLHLLWTVRHATVHRCTLI